MDNGMEKVGTSPEKDVQKEEVAMLKSAVEAPKEQATSEGDGSAETGMPKGADGEEKAGETPEDEQTPEVGSDEWYHKDREAFDKAYPNLDKEALFADEDFLAYAEGKVGEVPLTDIYDGFVRLKKSLSEKARTQAARANAAGSLRQAAMDSEHEYFTLAEMQGMSAKYIEDHWDKVQKSLKRLK